MNRRSFPDCPRECTYCGAWTDEFNKSQTICRDCQRERKRDSRERMRKTEPERLWARTASSNARQRSKKQGVACTVNEHAIMKMIYEQKGCCALCKTEMRFDSQRGKGVHHPEKATLDKVVPERGYVKHNMLVLCNRCNRRKSDMTMSDIRNLYLNLKKLERNKKILL